LDSSRTTTILLLQIESLHNSETIKMIIQVREIDREIREANNITDETNIMMDPMMI
jgi:hypothetical protein